MSSGSFYCYCRALAKFKFGGNGLSVNVKEGDWLLVKGSLGNTLFEPIAIANPEDSTEVYQCEIKNDIASKIQNPKISLLWDMNARITVPPFVDNVRIFDETYNIEDVFYNLAIDMYNSTLEVKD